MGTTRLTLRHEWLRHVWLRVAWIAGALFLLLVTVLYAFGANRYLWDFRLYYHAGLGANMGMNPYNGEELARLVPMASVFPVSYPWAALLPYRFLALFSFPNAILFFSLAKIVALLAILHSWRRLFPTIARDAFFPVLLFAAFNGTLLLDLRSGNVALFETALLAIAFAAYVSRRFLLFGLLVALAATIKIAPLFFLSLLFFTDDRRAWRFILPAVLLFAITLFLPLLIAPEAFDGFLRNATAVIDERGSICPSTLPVIRDLVRIVGLAAPRPEAIFVIAALVVAAAAAVAGRRFRSEPVRLLLLACFTYALVHPRFKDYAYVLLIGPAFHLLAERRRDPLRLGLALLVILPMRPRAFTGVTTFADWAHEYYPWFLVLFFWFLSLRRCDGSRCDGSRQCGSTS